jgi:pyruvyltransferase
MNVKGGLLSRFFGLIFVFKTLFIFSADHLEGIPLYYWQQKEFVNFGDYLSLKIVERIVDGPVVVYKKTKAPKKKLLALGSLLYFANTGDVLWGTGCNFKYTHKSDYNFNDLDIRALRGPLTKVFLEEEFNIQCPEIYGDPALLFPYLFPEFQKKEEPKYDYIFIPHLYEIGLFSNCSSDCIVYPTQPWHEVIEKILDSKFVISSSLHGIIIAEAFGIPARYLRLSEKEPLFKYQDYYFATGRDEFGIASSLHEALEMGGEPPLQFDPEPLYDAFPFEFWPDRNFKKPLFKLF